MKDGIFELIEKARQAKTSDELAELAKAENIDMTAEEAAAYFAQLNPVSGELSDDELENVSGGGCQTSAGGGNHTVVSSGLPCFTGRFEPVYVENEHFVYVLQRTDNKFLRQLWESYSCVNSVPGGRSCGRCIHLEFKNGTGYCGVS